MSDSISRQEAVKEARELFEMGDCYCDKFSIVGMLNSLPSAQPEIIRCKECKNRGIVNICPFSGYVYVTKPTSRGTDTLSLPYNYGKSQIQTYCNARDNDFCSRAERREDAAD